jgi:hypothetical protein
MLAEAEDRPMNERSPKYLIERPVPVEESGDNEEHRW